MCVQELRAGETGVSLDRAVLILAGIKRKTADAVSNYQQAYADNYDRSTYKLENEGYVKGLADTKHAEVVKYQTVHSVLRDLFEPDDFRNINERVRELVPDWR